MTDVAAYGSRLGRGGRVVIPAAVRRVLGLDTGDQVQFQVSDSGVQLVTGETMLRQVWARNAGPSADDNPRPADDRARQAARWSRLDASAAAEDRTADEIEAALLGQLGLNP
ncbi:MAG: AbrB/MazE/SpoVT family DNA-binding domain-containing protein [Propionibacteriaceae bacterium]|jgi:AbrB family looped-hinge helix DNA binding protein|nr:AbrB/MazE/SpoVT family DNA-binding domain-containing protein [Propionibacteriaceae bacterium]